MLVVGLGNPGPRYASTRHNVGFQLADAIAARYGMTDMAPKFSCRWAQGTIDQRPIRLIKPQNFMNLSGIAVSEWVRFYKIPLSEIVVIHDDLELKFGIVKVKTGGGTGGHNGLKSLHAHIGQDYHRIRIGIGRPLHGDVADFVLQPFTTDESSAMAVLIEQLTTGFPQMIAECAHFPTI